MRPLVFLLGWFLAGTVSADDFWVLQTGPEAVESIPLNPVQPVPAWRGLYVDGEVRIWVYSTRSPQFFPPPGPQTRRIDGTPWTTVAVFPSAWTATQQGAWFDRWVAEFKTLQSLPNPGWPITFPSILKKG